MNNAFSQFGTALKIALILIVLAWIAFCFHWIIVFTTEKSNKPKEAKEEETAKVVSSPKETTNPKGKEIIRLYGTTSVTIIWEVEIDKVKYLVSSRGEIIKKEEVPYEHKRND